MSGIQRIDAPDVAVTILADVTKQCPVLEEVDCGTVTITYQTGGSALELHALRDYLTTFKSRRLSHEAFTDEVARTLTADVRSHWSTAGMEVECHAVLRQSVHTEGA